MKPTPLLDAPLQLAGRLDARCFALLQAVADTGSLQRAARTAGYSYKGAWLLLETAANLLQTPLLEGSSGGRGGGGSRLSPAGAQLLAAWQGLQQRHHEYLQEQQAWLLAQPGISDLLRRLTMKATARNQFAGRIAAIAKGPASSLVCLDLGEGLLLQASVAGASLGLKKGQQAIALVKASEVVLFADLGGYRLAEDNQFAGTIARVVKGGASAQVVLTLPGGRTISATVTAEAVELLGLAPGQPALACFKPSSVMLAIA